MHTYLVKSGALRLLIAATGAASAIAQAIELYGLAGASARPYHRRGAQ